MDKSFALIIQSNRQTAAMFEQVLAEAGFQADIVSNYPDSLERLYRRLPWLLILDLDLPGIFGGKLLDTIRKDDRLRQIKVIAVTAFSQLAENLSTEPDLLLFKPVEPEQFADLLERYQLKIKFQTTVPMVGEPWDRVTGLYNQAFFMTLLERSLLPAREMDRHLFAVLTVSFDQDNRIKEQLEIKNWISALRVAAESLATTVRPTDTVARFDQDRFYILIDNIIDQDVPKMIAARICKNLQERLNALGHKVPFPVSAGILICDREYKSIDEILEDADIVRSLGESSEIIPLNCFDRASLGTYSA